MKATLFALLAATATASLDMRQLRPSVCNADNCARTVTGSVVPSGVPNQSSRRADCSSFFRATVIPATFTPTVTTVSVSTSTSTLTEGITTTTATVLYTFPSAKKRAEKEFGKRQAPAPTTITASTIPAYASGVCMGTSRYSSACACASVTSVTTTQPTPTAPAQTSFTSTSTSTVFTTTTVATVTVTSTACAPPLYDYLYPTGGESGAAISPTGLGTGLTAYQCCSQCYTGQYANCAGTVYRQNSNNECIVFTVNGGQTGPDPNAQCPNGKANIENRPGNEVALAACGTTRPVAPA